MCSHTVTQAAKLASRCDLLASDFSGSSSCSSAKLQQVRGSEDMICNAEERHAGLPSLFGSSSSLCSCSIRHLLYQRGPWVKASASGVCRFWTADFLSCRCLALFFGSFRLSFWPVLALSASKRGSLLEACMSLLLSHCDSTTTPCTSSWDLPLRPMD